MIAMSCTKFMRLLPLACLLLLLSSCGDEKIDPTEFVEGDGIWLIDQIEYTWIEHDSLTGLTTTIGNAEFQPGSMTFTEDEQVLVSYTLNGEYREHRMVWTVRNGNLIVEGILATNVPPNIQRTASYSGPSYGENVYLLTGQETELGPDHSLDLQMRVWISNN